MEKRIVVMLSLLGMLASQAHADGVTEALDLSAIEVRESGYHGLFLLESVNGPDSNVDFPDEGCDRVDRGIINANSAGGENLLAAVMNSELGNWKLVVKVSGCEFINGINSQTAPKIVMVKWRRFFLR